ncbi:MAG: DUF1570 domain-containing protein [Planctomycetales bacterium]|nr:DUF1570 domain-containing protein [Planctomycetales bacterium]
MPLSIDKTWLRASLICLALLVQAGVVDAQDRPAGQDAEEQAAEEGPRVSPAQGLVEKQLSSLIDIKSTPPEAATSYVRDADGKAVIAKVLCELRDGKVDKRMLMLPTGSLVFADRTDTRPCDRPFQGCSRLTLEKQLRAHGFGEFKFVHDGYYLYAYNCSEAFYQHTHSIISTMMAGVVTQLREWGLEVKRPETPMVILIFPSREAFDRYEAMPKGVAAYYNTITNWVYLYEDNDLWDAAPEFAMRQYAYTVAHEGIHQVLHNTGIQQRLSRWPAWISEGLPEYFCPLRVSSHIVTQGKDKMPERVLKWQRPGRVNDIRMWEIMRYAPQSDGGIVERLIGEPRLSSYGYALSWGLVHYLASREPEEFAAYLGDLSEMKPLQGNFKPSALERDELFVKNFGEDFMRHQLLADRHLKSAKIQKEYDDPFLNQTVYIVTRTYKKSRVFYTTAKITLSPFEAREWRQREAEKMRLQGHNAAFVTRVCDNIKEARYELRQILGN